MKRKIAAGLFLMLCLGLLCPALAPAAGADAAVIHIQTQDDLRQLAENCRLDTWSQGKTVILDNNLTLDASAEEFLPIPTFGGTFEGNGHVISGLSLCAETSAAGLFDTLQSDAVVRELTVAGQVAPHGGGDAVGGIAGKNHGRIVDCAFEGIVQGDASVGGIVGINEATGQVVRCRFRGSVMGEHYVGGIAGQNAGSLILCQNGGQVNTTVVEVSADLTDLSLLGTTQSVPAGTDIGGVAGFSSGLVQSCQNTGSVGYEHMGYNVGGVVGRQSGYLDGCSNAGAVQGRKDVGGIVGQLEPQVMLRYDEDTLGQLWTELDALQDLMYGALDNAQGASDALAADLDGLLSDVGAAKDAASDLSDAMAGWADENIGQINDVSARLSWVMDQAAPVLDGAADALDVLEQAAGWLDQALAAAEGMDEQAAAELQAAKDSAQTAAALMRGAMEDVYRALELAGDLLGQEQTEDSVQEVLDALNAAGEKMHSAAEAAQEAASHAGTAAEILVGAGAPGDAQEKLEQALDRLERFAVSTGQAADAAFEIVAALGGQPAISFVPVSSEVSGRGDALDAALAQMLDGVAGLQSSMASSTGALLSDFRAINEQMGVVVGLLRQTVEEAEEKDAGGAFEDVSDQDTQEETAGKISASVNRGTVSGDVNVAGIAGSLSVEYDFDPEDDLTEDGTRSLDFQYRALAVVTECVNEGAVSAKKNYAGGIVGRMDLGAVKACENYGDIESTGGDYVGGIAGLCRATVRGCYVKCTLSGGDYVGGVIGTGGDNSVVSDCCTLVEIAACGRYGGAVSGTETGTFSANRFVSDGLAGLGRISYAGMAEPIAFSELAALSSVPQEMTQFTLRFLVDGEEIKSETFSYGDSFGQDVFPGIPPREDCYAAWDVQDLTELHFDRTVTAEYFRYVLTLPSQAGRESGRPVFLVDGEFDGEAALEADRVESPEENDGRTAVEQWRLRCSDPSQEVYTVRYLSPEEDPEGLAVFVRQGDQWERAECTTFGSYLVFSVAAAEAEVAIVQETGAWAPWLAGGAGNRDAGRAGRDRWQETARAQERKRVQSPEG